MRGVCGLLACVITIAGVELNAQRRGAGRGGGTATLAIVVSDPAGAPVPGVLVTVEGPAERSARTEGGRIAFEGLPPGSYRLRFEREGFLTLERELTARGGAPIDVKVTLKPAPGPPAPPVAPSPPPKPAVDAKPAIFDVPGVFEKQLTGRGARSSVALACSDAASATLINVKDAIASHAHEESDEFLYVIGGEGNAQLAGRTERLAAGVLLFVPRGVPHALTSGRRPLVVMSTRAGEGCSDAR